MQAGRTNRQGEAVSWKGLLYGLLLGAQALPATAVMPLDTYHDAVRQIPLSETRGAFDKMQTIRRWVLYRQEKCRDQNQHVLFDGRGTFLRMVPTLRDDKSLTQLRLNQARFDLANQSVIRYWVAGQPELTGYPFALACEQPHVDMFGATQRYLGELSEDRFFGEWDGVRVGSKKRPVSLHDAVKTVYNARRSQGQLTFPTSLIGYLSGQVLIESGGKTNSTSSAKARGILQLLPSVLRQCKVPPKQHLHRIAQIDCALRLTEQNHRILSAPFLLRFGHLPADKREDLYDLLLLQAYHGGLGRVRALLNDPELSRPAQYFARNPQTFSAGDIAYGMVFHNLGRNQLGMASLYYVADVTLAARELCTHSRLRNDPTCKISPMLRHKP